MDEDYEDARALPRTGHWPLLWWALPLIIGYVLGFLLPGEVSPLWLLAVGLIALAVAQWTLKDSKWIIGLWSAFYLCGVVLLACAYWLIREPRPPSGYQLPPREATFSIRVDRLFADTRATGQVSGLGRIMHPPELLPHLKGQRVFFVVWPEEHIEAVIQGAVLRVRGRLAVIQATGNTYGFYDFLLRSGVYYELSPGSVRALVQPAPPYQQWARSVNIRMRDVLHLGVESEQEAQLAGISEAMLLGRKEALGQDQKSRFIESGTMHLFAVSGLHIGIVAAVLYGLFERLRLPRLAGALAGLTIVGLYVLIVGYPPSAMRALLMVALFWLALALVRKPSPMSALLASAIGVLLWNPQELLRPGFQLSYAVVGGILIYGLPLSQYLAERLRPFRYLPEESWSWWQRVWAKLWRAFLLAVGVSFSATLFSTPLTVAMFGVFSPGAVLLNTFLLPLASVALISDAFSAVLGLIGAWPLALWVNHVSWILNWLLDQIVALGLLAPGLFQQAQWRSLVLAPVTLSLMFLGYLAVLHLPPKPRYLWLPPLVLSLMLVLGLRLV